jgi:methylmalonyl-CoA mutase cobalamin-binding domain/chain
LEEILDRLAQAIIDGDSEAAEAAAKEAMAAGIPPLVAMNEGATKGITVVGERFECFESFLPDLMLAGRAMKAAVAVLLDALPRDGGEKLQRGKVIIATVAGDLHDIGKNIVASLLMASAFEVLDLGVDVEAKEIFRKAREVKADVIALSTLLTTSMPFQEDVRAYLRDSDSRDKHFVIVGGGPVTPEWAAQAGADGYGRTAAHAVELCKRLLAGDLQPPLAEPVIVDFED